MINIAEEKGRNDIDREIKTIKDFLLFKKEYEGKNFMDIWNDIVPEYFSEKDFCEHMKVLRREGRGIMFNSVFNAQFGSGIKNRNIDIRALKELVGTLMRMYNNPKFRILTNNYQIYLMENLNILYEERDKNKQIAEEKKKRKEDQVNKKKYIENEKQKKVEQKMETEAVINTELFQKYANAKHEFLNSKEVGYVMTQDDADYVFGIARKEFSQESYLPKKELDKIYGDFMGEFVY